MFHARRGTHDVLEVGFSALTRSSRGGDRPLPGARAGRSTARSPAAWDIAEALAPTRKPLDIQVTATDAGLDVDVRGSGPLTAERTAGLAAVAAKHRLARLTRHGELVAQRAVADRHDGTRPRGAAARRLPAGDRGGRGRTGAAGAGALRRGEERLPTCSPASDRSRCGLPSTRGSPPPTAMPAAIAALQRAVKTTQGLKPIEATVRDLFRQPLRAGGIEAVRCRGVRSAAPGRRGAGARACRERGAARRGGVVQSRDLRARCSHPGRWRLSS